jgi:hypothetical protein
MKSLTASLSANVSKEARSMLRFPQKPFASSNVALFEGNTYFLSLICRRGPIF